MEMHEFWAGPNPYVGFLFRCASGPKLRTPQFIQAHIRAFDAFGATEMADFWRSALTIYEQAYGIAEAKTRGAPLLDAVR
jgi:hypothetical protein